MNSTTTYRTAWQRVWRDGIAPQLSTKGLEGLQLALERNDGRLITGSTCFPPPLACVQHEPVEQCCPLCWAILDGKSPEAFTVGRLEERFVIACWKADERLGEPAAIRYFLNWADETPRETMRRELLAEVERTLFERSRQKSVERQPESLSPLAHLLGESIRLAEQITPA